MGKVSPTDNDRTLDVATRLAMGIDGPGTAVVLIQCATGRGWREKKAEPTIRMWRDLLRWNAELLRAVAVPFWIGTDRGYATEHRRFDGAMVIDRPRILATDPESVVPTDTVEALAGWCSDQLDALPRLRA